MSRTLAYTLVSASLLLAALGGYQALAPRWTPAGRLVVDRTESDFGSLPIGDRDVLIARVTNTGGRTAAVLGVTPGCYAGVCYDAVHAGPLAVPPGATVDVVCRVSLKDVRPLRFAVPILLENGTFETVPVLVRGTVVDSGEGHDLPSLARP